MTKTISLSDEVYADFKQFKAELIASGEGKNLGAQDQDFGWALAWLLENRKQLKKLESEIAQLKEDMKDLKKMQKETRTK